MKIFQFFVKVPECTGGILISVSKEEVRVSYVLNYIPAKPPVENHELSYEQNYVAELEDVLITAFGFNKGRSLFQKVVSLALEQLAHAKEASY
jgi:hypothetical protein